MNETRLSAALPQLDVEIVRREDADPDEQTLIIRLRAKPSFQAVAEHLAGRGLPLAAALLLSPPTGWWASWLRAASLPWQAAAGMMAMVSAGGGAQLPLPGHPSTPSTGEPGSPARG